jgi:hypothetical protein
VGSGYTVEGQKTGEEKHGGLQIEIIPAYKTNLRAWTLDREPDTYFNFVSQAIIDEMRTPAEMGLKTGDKIRSYPPSPVYDKPMEVFDMLEGSESKEIRVKARNFTHFAGYTR